MNPNNTLTYTVPDSLAGKSLNDLGSQNQFRGDTVAGWGNGLDPNAKLTSGQTLTLNVPDNYMTNSGEIKGLTGLFGAGKTGAQNLSDQQTAAQNNLFNTENTRLSDFNNTFQSAVPNIINSTSQKYNIPQLTDVVNGLNSRISELSGNTSNEGAGGFASGDQVDKALNTNYLPRFQTAISNLNTSTGQAQQEENQLLTPYTTQASMLNDQISREMTGFNAQQQNQLNGYLGQLNAGVALTQTQLNNANALAQAQLTYEGVLAQVNEGINTANIKNQFQIIPSGQTLVNTANGAFKTYG